MALKLLGCQDCDVTFERYPGCDHRCLACKRRYKGANQIALRGKASRVSFPRRITVDLPPHIKWHPEWPGYGGDEEGRTYSLRVRGETKPILMTGHLRRSGHIMLNLIRDGKSHALFAHVFLLELFVGPCPDGMECCHGNEGPSVNAIRNLRWDTRRENMRDIRRHGDKYGGQKFNSTDISEIKRLRINGLTFREIGNRFNVVPSHIYNIVNGLRWADF